LQTDADRARVIDGLGDAAGHAETSSTELAHVVKKLVPRWFLMRDAHASEGTLLVQPRWAMSVLRGPMTRNEIKRALAMRGEPPRFRSW
jgi:hypothetical protein